VADGTCARPMRGMRGFTVAALKRKAEHQWWTRPGQRPSAHEPRDLKGESAYDAWWDTTAAGLENLEQVTEQIRTVSSPALGSTREARERWVPPRGLKDVGARGRPNLRTELGMTQQLCSVCVCGIESGRVGGLSA